MTGRATSVALAVALAFQPGCGLAQRAAKGAAAGAVGTLASKVGDKERVLQLTEGINRRAASALVDELSDRERLDDLQRIAAALAAGTVSGATRAASGAPATLARPGERSGRGAEGTTPVESMASLAARAFSREITAELGRSGDGPLATSLSATSEQLTGSIARGARSELAPLFPECRGEDASKCLDRAVERMSRATSAGVAAGIRDSLGVWPLVLASGAGAFGALALVWAWGVYRARRPAAAS